MKFKIICLAFALTMMHVKLGACVSFTSSAAAKPSNDLQKESSYMIRELEKYRQQSLSDNDSTKRQRFREQRTNHVTKDHSAFSPLLPKLSNITSSALKPRPKPKRLPSCYRRGKKVSLTQYWIPRENEWDETSKGKRIFLGGDVKRPLYDKNKNILGMVPSIMYDRCNMEGFCLLENGDLINLDNATDVFMKVGSHGRVNNVFGLGSRDQNLVPFVSVAANDLPYGQTLYIPQLDGVKLGENQRHNGCVRVDDDSWSFESCQIDLFVNTYVDYLWLDISDRASVKVADFRATLNTKVIPSLLQAKFIEQ